MTENSAHHQPLLLRKDDDDLGCLEKTSLFLSSSKWVLKIAIWAIFTAWVAFMFLLPLESVDDWQKRWRQATKGTLFGITGLFAT